MKTGRRLITLLIPFAAALSPAPTAAQVEPSVGAEVVTRYVWRGFPYSRVAQVQPWAAARLGGLELGAWGSFGIDGEYRELDLWLGYDVELPKGSLTFTLNDYYFTDDFSDWGEWGGVEDGEATGAHTLELMATYFGPEELPIRLQLASTFYNDPKASIYGEAGYERTLAGLDWEAVVGALFRDGGYYETGSGGIVNLSLSASRSLVTVGSLELYVRGMAIHNPKLEDTFFVLALGF